MPEVYKIKKAWDVIKGKEFEIKKDKLSLNAEGVSYVILKLE